MAAGGLSAANQAQLYSDLASGRPIAYRRIPGVASGRGYYNPLTGKPVSQHYVLRIYRPALTDVERQYTKERVRLEVARARVQVNSLADTWMFKERSLGRPVTTRNMAKKDAEFQRLYQRLQIISVQARHAPLGSRLREELYAADGEYANLLVQLGRRLPNEDFRVGMSPLAVGEGESYIDEKVIPALYDEANLFGSITQQNLEEDNG